MTTLKDWLSFDAVISVIPASLAPSLTLLASDKPLTARGIAAVVIAGLIGWAGSLVAFRSMKYAQTKFTLTERPVASPEKSQPALID